MDKNTKKINVRLINRLSGMTIVATILGMSILLSACTWTDAAGNDWVTAPVEQAEYDEAMTYWQGAYSACMVHNLRQLAARGADIESDAVYNFADALCVRVADELLDMLGPTKWPFPKNVDPIATPCAGGCI